MAPLQRFVTHRRWLALLLALAVIIGAGVVLRNAWQVPYHQWRMHASWQQHISQDPQVSNGFVMLDVGRAHARYEHHRQRLVELGAVTRREYGFQHLLVPSPETRHFGKFLLSPRRPECIDFTYPYPDDPEPMHLTVWCYPQFTDAWDRLFRARDVSDYRSQFMNENTP